MNAVVRRHIETGTRAAEFSRAHPDTDAGYVNASGRLDELMVRANASATTQREGLIDARAASARKRELRRSMAAGPIAHLAEIGRQAARDEHELGTTFTFKPGAGTYLAFRTAARSMVAAAQAHTEVLVKHGLSATVLEEFVRMLDQFDEAMTLGRAGRTAHTGATLELEALATEVARAVRAMDGRNRQRFRNDSQLLGSWLNASTVLGRPRPVTHQGETTAAPAAGDVRPAA